ncbi:MAG: phytoene dehydrogenase-like protein, partial [Flavobacteriales bacterium]
MHDAIIIGSGPNGLAAAIALAQAGHSTLVLEASETPGGGVRSDALTLPGYTHDVCSAVHPTGALSPFFRTLPLEEHGLKWASCEASVAHPLMNGDTAMLYRSVEGTADRLGRDAKAYRRLVTPFLKNPEAMMRDLLAPLRMPSQPFTMARFGLRGLPSAKWLANRTFRDDSARALLAGCAAHSVLPLNFAATGAVGLVFLLTGHMVDWPVAVGGSGAITDALVSYYESLGGEIRCGTRVKDLNALPPHRVVLFDTAPRTLLEIAGDALPPRYQRT